MIVLDTHTLVWLDTGSERLGGNSRDLIDQAFKLGKLKVSAISFWEVAMLVEKRRLEIPMSVEAWRLDLLRSGLQEIPLTGDIAIASASLPEFHGDPADRIIVATAMHSGASLCTADEKILEWKQNLIRVDAGK